MNQEKPNFKNANGSSSARDTKGRFGGQPHAYFKNGGMKSARTNFENDGHGAQLYYGLVRYSVGIQQTLAFPQAGRNKTITCQGAVNFAPGDDTMPMSKQKTIKAEVKLLLPFENKLTAAKQKISVPQLVIETSEKRHATILGSATAKSDDRKNISTQKLKTVMTCLDDLHEIRKDEKEARDKAPLRKTSIFWSRKFLSSKKSQIPGLEILFILIIYITSVNLSAISTFSISNIEVECLLVYSVPPSSGLQESTPIRIVSTTCTVISRILGNLYSTNTYTIDITDGGDQITGDSARSEEEAPPKPVTRVKKVILYAIPVAVVVVGAWYTGWI